MSAPPYMKLYWGDYLKATRHLTRDQHGAYFLLIGEAWRLGGSLPDDDARLAAWALCTPSEWATIKPIITDFFAFRRGKWVHDRVCEELAHYADVSRKRKTAGKTGGVSKRGKDGEIAEAIATEKATKPEPEPEPIEVANATPIVRATKAKRGSRQCPPDWMPSAADLAVGAEEGFSPGEIERELSKMRDWTFKTARSDWSGVFRNWIRNAAERRPNRITPNGHAQPSPASARAERRMEDHLEGIVVAVDRVERRQRSGPGDLF